MLVSNSATNWSHWIFSYQFNMEVAKKTNVAFGTESHRKTFPSDGGHSRFCIAVSSISEFTDLGPGKYNNAEMTSMLHRMQKRPVSTKGYTLGARQGPRLRKLDSLDTPAPGVYDSTERRPITKAYKPFNAAVERDLSGKLSSDPFTTPGPGTYDHLERGCRQVRYCQSFGTGPTDLPCIKLQSTIPQNTNKLPTTTEEKRYLRKLEYLKLYYWYNNSVDSILGQLTLQLIITNQYLSNFSNTINMQYYYYYY